MEKEIIERWEVNKEYLKQYLTGCTIGDCESYKKLVNILIKECLNHDVYSDEFCEEYDVIDHGSYSGVQIFILRTSKFCPSEDEYYIFHNHYGSCSGCDTLKSILYSLRNYADEDYEDLDDEDNRPLNERQVNEIMTLLLHMVQRMTRLDNLIKE